MNAPNYLSPQEIATALTAFQKDIGDVAVVGGNLVRENLQSEIVVAAPRQTPLRNRFNRKMGNGSAQSYYVLKSNTDKSQGVFFGTTPGNAVFPKGGLPINNQEAYDLIATPYFNLGDIAEVTNQDQAQGATFTNLMELRTRIKMFNVAMMEEYFIINGDSSVVQSGGGRIFDGLLKQIKTRGGVVNVAPDGKLTVAHVTNLHFNQWQLGGTPYAIVMDGQGKVALTTQIAQFYAIRQNDKQALTAASGGISFQAYDFGYGEVDWIIDRYLVPDPTGTVVNGTNTAGAFNLISLDDMTMDTVNDGNVIEMLDLEEMHSQELAITTTSMRKVVYETTALKISVPQFQGLLCGLTYAGQLPS